MLEFKIIQELEPNAEILEIIKDYDFTVKNGKIKHLKATNLQFVEPIEYVITKPVILTIFEYYGYIRNAKTGHLEIEPIEAQGVKKIFELYKNGDSIRSIANTLNEEKAYLKQGKWNGDKVYKILTNSIYIGTFAYGKTKRKARDILYVDNYCEPIIEKNTWNITRKILEKNKHPNYGEHIHLFTGIVKCPDCGKIMSSTNSFKNTGKPNQKWVLHPILQKVLKNIIKKYCIKNKCLIECFQKKYVIYCC